MTRKSHRYKWDIVLWKKDGGYIVRPNTDGQYDKDEEVCIDNVWYDYVGSQEGDRIYQERKP